ncbi:MAG: c-type cytochrome [Burkholderiaceae bacterium]|nr:c-type cytochrome [Burkholderiaceae bacterium]
MTASSRTFKARWQRWSPVQRVFAVLAAVLTALFLMASALIAIELIAGGAINTPANGQNDTLKPPQDAIQRGAYLARVGNCAACHTVRGGAVYAGGKAIATPFGTVYTSNITPDPATGIGSWNANAFYRALHEGRSADGHLLTPAFPYPNYTHVTRADADALYAYFMHGVAPVAQPNRAHDLPFPYNTQVALAFWRLMFFEKADETAASFNPNTTKNIATHPINTPASGQNAGNNEGKNNPQADEIERGSYLVRGLGHCSACHAGRNALGASTNDQLLSGALMPMQDWYAPSLMAAAEAGVMHWPRQDVVALLKTGVAPNASMVGPMAEVVAGSTQYWTDADLQATAAYLQSLSESAIKAPVTPKTEAAPKPLLFARGAELFTQHCATCHGDQGQGMKVEGNVALPALAGNRAVTMSSSANLVRMILAGGYAPSTPGNPRPFGMPPFVHVLNDTDIAAVTTYIRNAWGNQADALSAADVVRQRQGVLR